MHPLINPNFLQMKDIELENKIQDLSKKYFQTPNSSVKQQILMVLDDYRQELDRRRMTQWQEQNQKRDTDLDNLINID